MKSVAPSLLAERLQRLGQRRGAARTGSVRAAEGLRGAGGAGRWAAPARGGAPGELLAASTPSCASSTSPWSHSRCHDGEVRVLHGQRRQRRGLPGGEGRVERGQLAHQHAHGPAVGDDVVHRQQQHVLAVAPAAAACARSSGPAARSKGRRASSRREPPRLGLALRRRAGARRSTTASGQPAAGGDDLDGLPVCGVRRWCAATRGGAPAP